MSMRVLALLGCAVAAFAAGVLLLLAHEVGFADAAGVLTALVVVGLSELFFPKSGGGGGAGGGGGGGGGCGGGCGGG